MKFNRKGIICGLLIGTIGISTVFAAAPTFDTPKITDPITQTSTQQATSTPISTADSAIIVEIDGKQVSFSDQKPIVKDGRTLVPVRGVFEQLGYNVSWDGNTQTVTLSNSVNTVLIVLGKSTFTTNGNTYNLDVPAQSINGRTMLPLRAVLESVGYSVDWDSNRNAVIVYNSSLTQNPVTTPTPIPTQNPVATPTPVPTQNPVATPTPTPASAMMYYDEFPTVPNFAWVVRDYLNITHDRKYWGHETVDSWGENPTVGYYYNLHETFSSDFRDKLHFMWDNQNTYDSNDVREFLSEYEVMYNLYIQTLLEEGFKETEGFTGFSKFRAGYGVIKVLQKEDVSVLVTYIWNSHGNREPYIGLEFDMGFTQISQPTPTPTPTPQPTDKLAFMNETYSLEFPIKIQKYDLICTIDSIVFTKQEKEKNGKIVVWFKANGIVVFDPDSLEAKNGTSYRIFDSYIVDLVVDCYNSSDKKIATVNTNVWGVSAVKGWEIRDWANKIEIPADTVRIEFSAKN